MLPVVTLRLVSPPADQLDDARLVLALAGGDRQALGVLYDRHCAALLGLATKFLSDRKEAEDVVHDVFIEAWTKAADFDPARGSVRAWLALRTRSRCLDRLKSARVRRSAPLEEGALERRPAGPAYDPELALVRGRVRQAVAQLPDGHRAVLIAAYFGGMTCTEIAEAQGLALGTVKSRLAAARAKLEVALS